MERPKERNRQGEGRRSGAEPFDQGGLPKCPSHDSKQSESRQNVNHQVRDMVTPNIRSADGIVDRKGEIQDGPTARGRADGSPQRGLPLADRWVVRDRIDVVEKQRNGKRAAIGRDHSGRENGSAYPPRPIEAPDGRGLQNRRLALGWDARIPVRSFLALSLSG